ncbi:hypothetical protein F5ESL0259_03355 [Lactobacillus sp. ESL0259]|nr:hypothetical protein F5ESL0259_03355 [Lactobacillus sp. ESL0259]
MNSLLEGTWLNFRSRYLDATHIKGRSGYFMKSAEKGLSYLLTHDDIKWLITVFLLLMLVFKQLFPC